MKQEQPFEIKEMFEGMLGNIINVRHFPLSDCFRYILAANAEIRRLQQQLADAPSWGEWQDANIKNMEDASAGCYEIEHFSGRTEIAFMFDGRWQTESSLLTDTSIRTNYARFRRLSYEPKPARESDDESNNKPNTQEQEGWTPISNVQPLYDLPNGMYIFKGKNGLPIFAIKDTIDGISSISLQASTRTPSMSWKPLLGDIVELFVSYKLIHAFEEPEKVIPTGAIENTLENRRKQRYGYYVFCADVADQEDAGDQEKPINQILLRDEVSDRWNHFEGWYNSDCIHMDCFEYFKPIDKDKFEAALETLAAQERVRELEANDD